MHSKIKAETTAKTAVTYWKAGNISDSEVPLLAAWLWGLGRAGKHGPDFGMSTAQVNDFISFFLTQVEMRYWDDPCGL